MVLTLVGLLAPAILAQTSGTVQISGTASAAVKLTSGGVATLTGNVGGGITAQSAADAALATVVNFGEVGPGNTSSYVCFTQPLFLRANAASTVSAAVTAESFPGSSNAVQKSDIGIGFQNLAAGGANADISTTTITAAYNANPCAATLNGDGIPTYSAALSSLSTSTPGTAVISSTGPISLRGNFNSPSNEADVDLLLAMVPQSYDAGAFSATLTLTMTTP
jgi:hypothetical protein